MSTVSDGQPLGATGVIHIECRQHSGEPSEYLVSSGGYKDGVGAFYLGKAVGANPLTVLLRKLGVPGPIIGTALQVLEAEPRHKISNVLLTQAMLRLTDHRLPIRSDH